MDAVTWQMRGSRGLSYVGEGRPRAIYALGTPCVRFCGQGYHGSVEQYLGYLDASGLPAMSSTGQWVVRSHLGLGEFAYTAACKVSDVQKQRKLRRARRPTDTSAHTKASKRCF